MFIPTFIFILDRIICRRNYALSSSSYYTPYIMSCDNLTVVESCIMKSELSCSFYLTTKPTIVCWMSSLVSVIGCRHEAKHLLEAQWKFRRHSTWLLVAVMAGGRQKPACNRAINWPRIFCVWRRSKAKDAGGWGFQNATILSSAKCLCDGFYQLVVSQKNWKVSENRYKFQM